MQISAGVEAHVSVRCENPGERDALLAFLQSPQVAEFRGITIVYDGPARHQQPGHDIVFLVPLCGIATSEPETDPLKLLEKFRVLRVALTLQRLQQVQAELYGKAPEALDLGV